MAFAAIKRAHEAELKIRKQQNTLRLGKYHSFLFALGFITAGKAPVGAWQKKKGRTPSFSSANHRVRFYFANVMDQWRMMVEDGELPSVCTPSVPLDSTVAYWCTFSEITATVLSWVLQTYRSGERICGRDAKVRSECQRIMS